MPDIWFLQIVLFERPHEGRNGKETMTMAGEKQLGRNDRIDRCQLPLRLLIDPGIQQIKVGNHIAADLENPLPFEILTAGVAVFGTLLFGDQTSPTKMLFEGVFFILLLIPVDSSSIASSHRVPTRKGIPSRRPSNNRGLFPGQSDREHPFAARSYAVRPTAAALSLLERHPSS